MKNEIKFIYQFDRALYLESSLTHARIVFRLSIRFIHFNSFSYILFVSLVISRA